MHDVDYYVIILRRLYREIERIAKTDSRVANLKGQYRGLVKKIKIRDHFEHGVDFQKIPEARPIDMPGLKNEGRKTKIATSLFDHVIVSGPFKWDLNEDHKEFLELIDKFIKLYPYKNGDEEMSSHY